MFRRSAPYCIPVPVTVFRNGIHVLYSNPPFLFRNRAHGAGEDVRRESAALYARVRFAVEAYGVQAVEESEELRDILTKHVPYDVDNIIVTNRMDRNYPEVNEDVVSAQYYR